MSTSISNSSAGDLSSRRPPGQSKSGRRQYTACGACRLRRVRCDLKDLQAAATGEIPQVCSNCAQRGLNCIDEYADLKASKREVDISHQGKSLLQNEAPIVSPSFPSSISPDHPSAATAIHHPEPEFFRSPFFRQLSIHKPIFDSLDFQYLNPSNNESTSTINIERKILALTLLALAASLGVDERGIALEVPNLQEGRTNEMRLAAGLSINEIHKERTHELVHEILLLVDSHGILRNPTWDGVRLLLLLWPLTQGVQSPLERVTMYETIISQIRALCRFVTSQDVHPTQELYRLALSQARVVWYAFTHEGVTNALRGGRLILNEEDLEIYQDTLPARSLGPNSAPNIIRALSDPHHTSQGGSALRYQISAHNAELTLLISVICRKIHEHLTGPRARQLASDQGQPIQDEEMMDIWRELDECWDRLENARDSGMWNGAVEEAFTADDLNLFVDSWQIFLFECHNIVREALKQLLLSYSSAGLGTNPQPSSFTTIHANISSQSLVHKHHNAIQRCRRLLPSLLNIMRRHLRTTSRVLFRSDIGLVRDGCSFAGLIIANSDLDEAESGTTETLTSIFNLDEALGLCIQALDEMGWVFSGNLRAKQTLISAWEARKTRDRIRFDYSQGATGDRSSETWSSHPHAGTHTDLAYRPAPYSLDSDAWQQNQAQPYNLQLHTMSSSQAPFHFSQYVDSTDSDFVPQPDSWYEHNNYS